MADNLIEQPTPPPSTTSEGFPGGAETPPATPSTEPAKPSGFIPNDSSEYGKLRDMAGARQAAREALRNPSAPATPPETPAPVAPQPENINIAKASSRISDLMAEAQAAQPTPPAAPAPAPIEQKAPEKKGGFFKKVTSLFSKPSTPAPTPPPVPATPAPTTPAPETDLSPTMNVADRFKPQKAAPETPPSSTNPTTQSFDGLHPEASISPLNLSIAEKPGMPIEGMAATPPVRTETPAPAEAPAIAETPEPIIDYTKPAESSANPEKEAKARRLMGAVKDRATQLASELNVTNWDKGRITTAATVALTTAVAAGSILGANRGSEVENFDVVAANPDVSTTIQADAEATPEPPIAGMTVADRPGMPTEGTPGGFSDSSETPTPAGPEATNPSPAETTSPDVTPEPTEPESPTVQPTEIPTPEPTSTPEPTPSAEPTENPEAPATATPNIEPSSTPEPTSEPSAEPTPTTPEVTPNPYTAEPEPTPPVTPPTPPSPSSTPGASESPTGPVTPERASVTVQEGQGLTQALQSYAERTNPGKYKGADGNFDANSAALWNDVARAVDLNRTQWETSNAEFYAAYDEIKKINGTVTGEQVQEILRKIGETRGGTPYPFTISAGSTFQL